MRLNFNNPITLKGGFAAKPFRDFLLRLGNLEPIVGTGSPEGVVTAPLYSVYLDQSGSAGSIQYRKMQADIGGDTSMGWVGV